MASGRSGALAGLSSARSPARGVGLTFGPIGWGLIVAGLTGGIGRGVRWPLLGLVLWGLALASPVLLRAIVAFRFILGLRPRLVGLGLAGVVRTRAPIGLLVSRISRTLLSGLILRIGRSLRVLARLGLRVLTIPPRFLHTFGLLGLLAVRTGLILRALSRLARLRAWLALIPLPLPLLPLLPLLSLILLPLLPLLLLSLLSLVLLPLLDLLTLLLLDLLTLLLLSLLSLAGLPLLTLLTLAGLPLSLALLTLVFLALLPLLSLVFLPLLSPLTLPRLALLSLFFLSLPLRILAGLGLPRLSVFRLIDRSPALSLTRRPLWVLARLFGLSLRTLTGLALLTHRARLVVRGLAV